MQMPTSQRGIETCCCLPPHRCCQRREEEGGLEAATHLRAHLVLVKQGGGEPWGCLATTPEPASQPASIERLPFGSSFLVGRLVRVVGNVAQAAQVAMAVEAWEEEAPSPHLDTSQFPWPSGAHGEGGQRKERSPGG
ncbi:UNVERIFIED_CONTAM: hypothetical protein K2H54_054601 [Gekko kuhli]